MNFQLTHLNNFLYQIITLSENATLGTHSPNKRIFSQKLSLVIVVWFEMDITLNQLHRI